MTRRRATCRPAELQTWSGAETLRDQDFADITAAELEQDAGRAAGAGLDARASAARGAGRPDRAR